MMSISGFRDRFPAVRKAPEGAHGRLPLSLFLALALAGAAFPVIQASRQPEPWLASVSLGLDGRSRDAAKTLDIALREVRTSRVLGRAVDLLGLDRDPEFSGSASTGLGVALEILTREGSGPADARRRAIQHLQNTIGIERKPGSETATLLVKASGRDKAMRIAEAIATVYASGSELTGSIGPQASTASRERLETAQAALADFSSRAGATRLSEALVLKSRMEGLDRHINELSAQKAAPQSAIATATLKDVLDGRVPLAEADGRLDGLRQSWLSARMAADALAVSLGPKHPRLLAARSTAEAARQALADHLARVKTSLAQADKDRVQNLKTLQAARADLARQIDATGIDLGRHAELVAAVDAARKDFDASASAAASGGEPVFEASVPQPLDVPARSWPYLRIGLGALAGMALALTFVAWRRQPAAPSGGDIAAPEASAAVTRSDTPAARVEPVMAAAAGPAPATASARLPETAAPFTPAVALPRAAVASTAVKPRSRSLDAANAASADMPQPRPSLGLDRVAPEDLPLIEKLRQVAPHVFAHPAEEAELERLRQELAEIRARVLERKASAA